MLSADTLPIEQQVNGVDGMLYMSSNSSASGAYSLTVTFEVGTDIDMATVGPAWLFPHAAWP